LKNTLPIILQTERAECGLACLAMVLSYFNYHTSLVELRKQHHISSNGLNLDNLVEISHDLHLSTRPLRLEVSMLKDLQMPCILHWNMNHFVVLKEVRQKYIVVHDPANGLRKVPMEEVNKKFTGVALEVYPDAQFRKKESKPKFSLTHLWTDIVGVKRNFAKIVVLSALAQVFVLVAPYYIQTVIDRVLPTNDENLLLILALGFVMILIFQQLTHLVRTYIILYVSTTFAVQVASNLFRHLTKLPLTFFEKRDVGDVVTRFESLNKIKEFLTTSFVEALVDGVMTITVIAILFYYDSNLTFIILGFVTLYTVFRIVAFKRFRALNETEITTRAHERSNFIETVQNIQTIMIFDAQPKRVSQWNNLYVDNVNSGLSIQKTRMWYQVVNASIFGIENILVIYFLAMAILEGSMSVGMLTAYIAYKQMFTRNYATFLDNLMEFKMLGLHLERVAEVSLTEIVTDKPINSNDVFNGHLRLENICYRYDDFSEDVLNNINLTVKPGEHIAITGPSGVGKSTLVKIMLGLHEPTGGKITIDGRDINEFGKRNFRKGVAAVMQDDQLYIGSILDNISFFTPEPDIEFAKECAKMAQIHDNIMCKPMAYNSLIGAMGSSLSGGEKQRVILARALYKRPKLILMDEASSNLDIKTEMAINQAIAALDITRIIIAHRPQTIRSATKVYRLTYQGLSEMDPQQVAMRPPQAGKPMAPPQ
jgi:ATP-binding cassette subfamily B protein RaxB